MKNNFINAQIKELRKTLKLNQSEFGERIGLKSGAIGKMEKDGGTVIEQNIKLICEKFHVRREWLTEGTGEMLQETEDSLFSSFTERYKLSPDDKILAQYLLRLTSEERQMVIRHILELSDLIRNNRPIEDLPFFDNDTFTQKAAAESMQTLSLEEQEAAEIAAVHEKYRAMREAKAAPATTEPPAMVQEELPLDPAIEEKAAKFRAKLYAQDKTRRILTGSADTGNCGTNETSGK